MPTDQMWLIYLLEREGHRCATSKQLMFASLQTTENCMHLQIALQNCLQALTRHVRQNLYLCKLLQA